MSLETNKYTFLRIKKDTHQMVKIASAKKGCKNMDEYVKSLLAKDLKPINEEIKKKQNNNRKGGFSIGF